MTESIAQFHFLRAWGLLITLAGLALLPACHMISRRRDALSRMIAPHLLPHLALNSNNQTRFRPLHGFSLLLVVAGLSVAGPTWDRLLPPNFDDQTRVTVVLDLSASMADTGTLALAQDRIQSLAERRPGWHTGLIGYARSAHRVLPHSRDRQLLSLYLNSLEAGMIPGQGRNLAAALDLATAPFGAGAGPQTVILVSDNLASAQFSPSQSEGPGGLKVLALLPEETLASGATHAVLNTLSADTRAFTTTEQDVRWLERQVQTHFQRQQNLDDTLKWRDYGYWLVWPALLLALVSMRKGWNLQWCLVALPLLMAPAPPANADALANAFLTPDQQGRLAFEAGDYADAARLFRDPYLRGLAAYRAADFETAIESFSQLDSPRAWFYLGNSYARQLELGKAKVAFETALEKDPGLEAARANLRLVEKISEDLNEGRTKAPDIGADAVRFDKQSGQGVSTRIQGQEAITDAIWLENLNTSVTDFLKRKFAAEQRNQTGEQP
ncbi:VWA domain-containing protein [Marinobacter sp. F4218]|uniref:VWA domain-containing protein n=1 Tax=Marinobacter sp. F4218 TaxID=2862868 RepID=UPI001C625A63|nr:VWA domain-containing protein [Marinobacter sp. F4218]MBW7472158.1 VWA domain-containing protein [Marinobacter sp. F4218]